MAKNWNGEWQAFSDKEQGSKGEKDKQLTAPANLLLLAENLDEIEMLRSDNRIRRLLTILQQEEEQVFWGAWNKQRSFAGAELSEELRGELTAALQREIREIQPKLIISFGDFLLKTLTKRLDFQIDLEEDQLYMIDLAGRSYCLYPLPEIFHTDWEKALGKLEQRELLRLRRILGEAAAGGAIPAKNGVAELAEKVVELTAVERSEQGSSHLLQNWKSGERSNSSFVELRIDPKQRKTGKKLVMISADADGSPARYALLRVKEVFDELGMTTELWDLTAADQTAVLRALAEATGAVIAVTVDWYGVGGHLQSFLDACHLYKAEGLLEGLPLLSIVLGKSGYEREAEQHLTMSWRLLGGWQGESITGAFAEADELAANAAAREWIEKKAEQYYRYSLNQSYQLPWLLSAQGNQREAQAEQRSDMLPTPEASALKKERANVQALSNKLKLKLEQKTRQTGQSLVELVRQNYRGRADGEYRLQFMLRDKPSENMAVLIKPMGIHAYAGMEEDVMLTISLEEELLRRCLNGELSFQRAFMTGQLTAKGELTMLYKMDEFF